MRYRLEDKIEGYKLPKAKKEEILFDSKQPGLALRIRRAGSRKYVVHYRFAGVQRRDTIGSVAILTLDEARKKARRILAAVDDERDPRAEKEEKRAIAALLLGAVADDYLEARKADLRPRSLEMSTYYLKHHWKPLHRLPLKTVGRDVIASRLRVIARESGPNAANRARSTLSAMYAWAIGEGLCDANPVLGTNQATEKPPRDRVLSDSELAAIWNAAPDNDYGRIVRLLMLTGQRRHEIGGLRWAEINYDKAQIELPPDRTKNGRRHDVPLSPAAMAIIQSTVERRHLVFGEGRDGFASYAECKALLDQETGINEPWTIHDLRRTTATGMADLGVQPHVIEAVLNHVSGHKAGVAGIYNRSSYAAEKRAALELWANHVTKRGAKT